MKQQPLISVVIPFFKGEPFIAETLESVLSQDYPRLEIIVANDGSPAGSLRALDPFAGRIAIISQENKGQAAARNAGIRLAKGPLIALLDQDDLWPAGRASLMAAALAGDPSDFARGMTQRFRPASDGTGQREDIGEPEFRAELVGSALYRREVFDRIGLFDEAMREGEDFDWNIRLGESACREKRLGETTLLCRRHGANLSDTEDFVKNGQMLSLRKKIARARAESATAEKTP